MGLDGCLRIEGLLKTNLELNDYGDIVGIAFIYIIE